MARADWLHIKVRLRCPAERTQKTGFIIFFSEKFLEKTSLKRGRGGVLGKKGRGGIWHLLIHILHVPTSRLSFLDLATRPKTCDVGGYWRRVSLADTTRRLCMANKSKLLQKYCVCSSRYCHQYRAVLEKPNMPRFFFFLVMILFFKRSFIACNVNTWRALCWHNWPFHFLTTRHWRSRR